MKELELVDYLTPLFVQNSNVVIGPGDDCAVLKFDEHFFQLATVDQLAANVHYTVDTSAKLVARKLFNRNLSDIAAMGGIPDFALLTVASSRPDTAWFKQFFKSLSEIAKKNDVSISGGDISSVKPLNAVQNKTSSINEIFTLSLFGKVACKDVILRSGAKKGDIIYVTGSLGNSFASNHHLTFSPRLDVGQFLAQNHFATAMIDISDGLLLDLKRLAAASSVAMEIDINKLPLRNGASRENALNDGEDYELIFTVSQAESIKLEQEWNFADVSLTQIGTVKEMESSIVFDVSGVNLSEKYKNGFIHNNE